MTFKSTDRPLVSQPARNAIGEAGQVQVLTNLLTQLEQIDGSAPASLAWEGGNWKVDFWRQCVSCPAGVVRLNIAELVIFGRLLAADGAALGRHEFHAPLMRLWAASDPKALDTRLKLNISRMRAKFAQAGLEFPVRAVRGVGYRLVLR